MQMMTLLVAEVNSGLSRTDCTVTGFSKVHTHKTGTENASAGYKALFVYLCICLFFVILYK